MQTCKTQPLDIEDLAPWPPGFSRERFSPDSRIRRHGDIELELIRHPARNLGRAADLVLAELMRLTVETSPIKPGSYLAKTFEQVTLLIIARQGGVPVGYSFASDLEVDGRRFVWLIATFYSKQIRGRNLATVLNRIHTGKALRESWLRPIYVVARTQNPLVIASLLRSPIVYPRPGKRPPASLQRVASQFYAHIGLHGEFDPRTLVAIGGVPREEIDPDPPRHRKAAVNAFCDAHLNYSRGDLFLMIAKVDVFAYAVWSLVTLVNSLRMCLSRRMPPPRDP